MPLVETGLRPHTIVETFYELLLWPNIAWPRCMSQGPECATDTWLPKTTCQTSSTTDYYGEFNHPGSQKKFIPSIEDMPLSSQRPHSGDGAGLRHT